MPRSNKLSREERLRIPAWRANGVAIAEIARRLDVTPATVRWHLQPEAPQGRALQPCGETGAYRRHLLRGDPVCGPCWEANRRYAEEDRASRGIGSVPVAEAQAVISDLRAAGMGTAQIAAAAQVSRFTVNRLEQGLSPTARLSTMQRLRAALRDREVAA